MPAFEKEALAVKSHSLITAGQALDIAVLDHLIITHKGFFSFADEGII